MKLAMRFLLPRSESWIASNDRKLLFLHFTLGDLIIKFKFHVKSVFQKKKYIMLLN